MWSPSVPFARFLARLTFCNRFTRLCAGPFPLPLFLLIILPFYSWHCVRPFLCLSVVFGDLIFLSPSTLVPCVSITKRLQLPSVLFYQSFLPCVELTLLSLSDSTLLFSSSCVELSFVCPPLFRRRKGLCPSQGTDDHLCSFARLSSFLFVLTPSCYDPSSLQPLVCEQFRVFIRLLFLARATAHFGCSHISNSNPFMVYFFFYVLCFEHFWGSARRVSVPRLSNTTHHFFTLASATVLTPDLPFNGPV